MTKSVKIGQTYIGGGNKIAIQSMTNTRTCDEIATINQIQRLQSAGCDLIRVAVLDDKDAKSIKSIKKEIQIPLVCDIHFDYKLALECIYNGADKIRINPGNIGGKDNIEKVAKALKEYNIPVRVGSNSGSIEKEFLQKYGKNEISLSESALKNVSILENLGVENIVISVKASSAPLTVKSYEYISKLTSYPLHIGVTEAGTTNMGIVKSSIGIGSLLLKGIGDTLRVSLTADPIEEIYVAKKILRALEFDKNYVDVISCPTCGRCEWESMKLAEKVEKLTSNINKSLKVAVMGCVVNGPGEAKDCDLGIAGGRGGAVIFKKGEIYKKVSLDDAEKIFIEEIEKIINE